MGRLEDLVAAQHRRYIETQMRAAALASRVWAEFGGPGDDDLAAFVDQVTPIMEGARIHTVDLMAGFLALAVRQPVPIDTDKVLAGIRGGVPIETVYSRPVITMRSALSAGKDLNDAAAEGLARLESTARADVILANRDAAVDGMSNSDAISGYMRVPTNRSCEFCVGVADQTYASDELMPIHNNCDCGIAPIIGSHNPGRTLNRSLPELAADAPPVAVHDHGELGPVLGDADHDFTGADEVPV